VQTEPSQPQAPTPLSHPKSHAWVEHYTFVDYATQGYLVLVALIVLCLGARTVPFWPLLLLAHGAAVCLVQALIQLNATRPRNHVVEFLRHFYPVLLYTGFYRETGVLNQGLISGFLDPFFIRLETHVFGLQPSLAFMDRLPYPGVSELFYAAYFSYYLMIVGVGLALFLRKRGHFFHYVSVVSFTFYVCYLIYIFTPVMGPRIFFREITDYHLPPDVMPAVQPVFPDTIQAGLFYQIMAFIYRVFEAPGAAFPSSHVAIALCTLFFSFRYLRPIRWVHLVVVVLLCLSTVYCRYHYVVDVVAGLLTATILIPLGNWLYLKFRRLEET
jgi:membrane-associated phospholipid phosphatase